MCGVEIGQTGHGLVLHVVQPTPPTPPIFIEQSVEDETRLGQDLVTQIPASIKAALHKDCSGKLSGRKDLLPP